jgi:phosphotransacetylase
VQRTKYDDLVQRIESLERHSLSQKQELAVTVTELQAAVKRNAQLEKMLVDHGSRDTMVTGDMEKR